jgi:hypothetical protein
MFQQPIRNIQRWRTVQAILLRYGFDFLIGREEIAEVRRFLHNTLRLPMGEFNELSPTRTSQVDASGTGSILCKTWANFIQPG